MYDGMRPFLRYKGDTQSKFLLTLGDDIYFEMKNWFTEKNGGEELIHKNASSRKLKMQTKMVGLVKASLKQHNSEAYKDFIEAMETATDVTTQKRFYMSEYGYSNSKDVLLGKTDTLIKAVNYDRFELENVIAWWKKNASKRYDKMIREDRLRNKLEVWNKDSMNEIDIIR
jgi:predicted S18 family serine protease